MQSAGTDLPCKGLKGIYTFGAATPEQGNMLTEKAELCWVK